MNSSSVLYNMVLMPLVMFGGFSVMLCFVLLLPGVGQGLAVIWTLAVGDHVNQKRLAKKNGTATP